MACFISKLKIFFSFSKQNISLLKPKCGVNDGERSLMRYTSNLKGLEQILHCHDNIVYLSIRYRLIQFLAVKILAFLMCS